MSAFLKKHWLALLVVLGALVFLALEPGRNIVVSILGGGAGILIFLERLLGGGKKPIGQPGPSAEKQLESSLGVLQAGASAGQANDAKGLRDNSDGQAKLDSAIGATDEALKILGDGKS